MYWFFKFSSKTQIFPFHFLKLLKFDQRFFISPFFIGPYCVQCVLFAKLSTENVPNFQNVFLNHGSLCGSKSGVLIEFAIFRPMMPLAVCSTGFSSFHSQWWGRFLCSTQSLVFSVGKFIFFFFYGTFFNYIYQIYPIIDYLPTLQLTLARRRYSFDVFKGESTVDISSTTYLYLSPSSCQRSL